MLKASGSIASAGLRSAADDSFLWFEVLSLLLTFARVGDTVGGVVVPGGEGSFGVCTWSDSDFAPNLASKRAERMLVVILEEGRGTSDGDDRGSPLATLDGRAEREL